MSQIFFADMIRSTRSTVSRTAGTLKDEGLIDYTRGVIRILDVPGLQNRSCECYAIIKNHLDKYAEFDDGRTE